MAGPRFDFGFDWQMLPELPAISLQRSSHRALPGIVKAGDLP